MNDWGIFPTVEVISSFLEIKSDVFPFSANALPHIDGQLWIPLGLPEEPVLTCPEGLNIAGEDWYLSADIFLDFGGAQDAYADENFETYHCYQGQESPFPRGDLSAPRLMNALGIIPTQRVSNNWDITCIGPHSMHLSTFDSLKIQYQHTVHISPTETLQSRHMIIPSESMTITLETNLPLEDTTWEMYGGNYEAPNFDDPVTSTTWTDPYENVWFVADIPPDTPDGAYTLIITATSVLTPSLSTWTVDSFWVGVWVAPGTDYDIFLPVMFKQD